MTKPLPALDLAAGIGGVTIIPLCTHADERGFFREVIRASDARFAGGFGQLSHSEVFPGVLKAWHSHRLQHQWTYVVSGTLLVALVDVREGSPTRGRCTSFLAGANAGAFAYGFPPGILHGYRNMGGTAQVLYLTSGQYDPDDEVRIGPFDPTVPFDWRAVAQPR